MKQNTSKNTLHSSHCVPHLADCETMYFFFISSAHSAIMVHDEVVPRFLRTHLSTAVFQNALKDPKSDK